MAFEDLSDEAVAYATRTIECKARQMVGQAGLTSSDVEDLQQEMWADLIYRASWFESDRANAKTFISRVVSNRVSAILRHRSAAGRDYRRDGGSLSENTVVGAAVAASIQGASLSALSGQTAVPRERIRLSKLRRS